MLSASIVGERHYQIARAVRYTLGQYDELRDIIAMLGIQQLSTEDRKVVNRARRMERFLSQPFFTTEQFTAGAGCEVALADTLEGCERILNDEFQNYPEDSLYMLGKIDEAKKPNSHHDDS